jgi:hypothetical protein
LAKTSIAVILDDPNVDSAAWAVTIMDVPPEDQSYEVEVLDGELVAAGYAPLEPRPVERVPVRVAQPGVQTAVAAATGFVAGAATMALLRRYGQARLERPTPAPPPEQWRPPQTRTFVVHVRQLG